MFGVADQACCPLGSRVSVTFLENYKKSSPMSETLSKWVAAINENLGTKFEMDESGSLFVECEGDRRVGVDLSDNNPFYVIYTPLGQLSSTWQLPRLLAALQLNLYQRATAGGVIALDMPSGTFVYSFSYPVAQSSAELLAQQLDRFIEHANRLQNELEQVADSNAEFDFELQAMKQDLALLDPAEVEEVEGQSQLEDPDTTSPGMLRV